MNKEKLSNVCKCVESMDKYLRGKLQNYQLWENTYICKQIDRRKKGVEPFTIEDYIRAMVYSMLSSASAWERLAKDADPVTGKITKIDTVFKKYEPDKLLKTTPESLTQSVIELKCGNEHIYKQIEAIRYNIKLLQRIEAQCESMGGIYGFYRQFSEIDPSMKTLVLALSNSDSPLKMKQMGEALTAEYLRNIGFDLAKPDRHIRRILGRKRLGCSDKETVPIYEAFDIVAEIAREMNKPTAEVDYILWSFCANGYGAVCSAVPKCKKNFDCPVKNFCMHKTNYCQKS